MKRREFITLFGGTVAWPVSASAQQQERMRRIGVLMNVAASDPEGQARITAFAQGLQETGWVVGRNVRLDYRWSGGDPEHHRQHARELVALAPDVILAATSLSVAVLQQITRTTPIVFVQMIDPVSGGFVDTLAHPGGNATGFIVFEYAISGKWLELLREIAPSLKRVAVIRDVNVTAQIGQLGAIQSAAQSFGVDLRPVDARDAGEIERSMAAFVSSPNGGLITLSGSSSLSHRELIISLAAKYRLPAVYSDRVFVRDGGLMSYDPDRLDEYRRAAAYIDRILRGEKPADLPVQTPTRYELFINMKTAKALGLDVPASVLARADEVIE